MPNLCDACAGVLPGPSRVTPTRIVALTYRVPVTTLVHWMKFESNLAATRALGTLLAEAVAGAMDVPGVGLPNAIVPVPLHRDRLRSRGFNQAVELARSVGRRLGLPLLTRACLRTRATVPQSTLASKAARRRNVAGVFRVCHPLPGLARVAIVDDVLTTGATVAELARTLRAAGVGRVSVWVCAGRLPVAQASRLATDRALVSMNSRRGST